MIHVTNFTSGQMWYADGTSGAQMLFAGHPIILRIDISSARSKQAQFNLFHLF